MAEDTTKTDVKDIASENTGETELTIDSVVEIAPQDLSDSQKSFILDNADDLSDEQKDTYKEVLETKEEEIDPDKIEVKTRVEEKEEGEKKETTDEEEDEIDPEDRKNIGKIVKEELEDFRGTQSEVQELKDQREVDNYISNNPTFKPYKAVILKHLAHPAYRNVPVDRIAVMVAGEDLQKIGARKEREAAARARATKDAGNTARTQSGGNDDWITASKEAFERKKNEVMGIPND